ncbi:MAG: PilX N-terminal domain-containing pilus assembly protein [Gammaproteobacteria bacterium]|nr:PilX N-terminal domain-containing pilus assembly protein [Gammaproteobacteria bacterium]
MMNNPVLPRQHGAALVVGLMMLLALTLIGVTTMGMNTMELRMANNAQNKSNAFQASEAGLEVGVGLTDANDITTDPQVIPPPVLMNATAVVDSRFVGLIPGRGSGFTAGVACPGSSPERTRCAHFEVRSIGQHLQSNASSMQLQGFYVLAPQAQ